MNKKEKLWLVILLSCMVMSNSTLVNAQDIEHIPRQHLKDTITLGEVVVKSKRQLVTPNSISTTLTHDDIARAAGKSLASMLENVSGVSMLQTGASVAKPVIHGMYGNRILVVSRGAKLTGQQWGIDHAPEIDKNAYNDVVVVKGSESVRYGAEALGGIILMNAKPLPYGSKSVQADVMSYYGSNGRQVGTVGQIQGTLPFNRQIAWSLQGTFEQSGDRSTAAYLLNNTGMRQRNVAFSLGYQRDPWKFETGYSLFWQKMGVMRSAQMGNEQLLQERIRIGQPVDFTPFTYQIDYPFQRVAHHSAFFNVYYRPSSSMKWSWETTYQADDRRENRIRRMNHSDIPSVSLRLQSLQSQLHGSRLFNRWKAEWGVQGVLMKNSNERGTGVVPVIPNYTETTFGTYAIAKYLGDIWGTEAGVRYDNQLTRADGYDWTGHRYGGNRHFENVTFTLGGHQHLGNLLTLATNFGMAWRAPHVYELYSNGNELSSGTFVKGDSTLRSEQSYKWVTSLCYHDSWVHARIDAYLQWINHYIYDYPTRQNVVVVSGAYPVFQYVQTNALFRGVDVDVHLYPLQTLDYRVYGSWIWANEQRTKAYLPYIPSFKFTQQLTWTPSFRGAWQPSMGIEHRYVAKQRRFNAATDLTDDTPSAYHLVGFNCGVTWKMPHHQQLSLLFEGTNVLNQLYKEYTNRSRYYAHDLGRDIRCTLRWKLN